MAKLTKEEILQKKAEYSASCSNIIEEQRVEVENAIKEYKEKASTATKAEKKELKTTIKEEKQLLKRLIKIRKRHLKTIGTEDDDEIEIVPPDPEVFERAMNDK